MHISRLFRKTVPDLSLYATLRSGKLLQAPQQFVAQQMNDFMLL